MPHPENGVLIPHRNTQIAQAKHDLAHVDATIRMFTNVECQRTRYAVSHGFFKRPRWPIFPCFTCDMTAS